MKDLIKFIQKNYLAIALVGIVVYLGYISSEELFRGRIRHRRRGPSPGMRKRIEKNKNNMRRAMEKHRRKADELRDQANKERKRYEDIKNNLERMR